jgi:hypothetical protein
LSALKELKADKVAIRLAMPSIRYGPSMTLERIEMEANREVTQTGRQMNQEWWTMMYECIARAKEREQLDKVWEPASHHGGASPDLACLVKNRRKVMLKCESSGWEYTLGETKLTIDGMMEHWRRSVGKNK